MQSNNPVFRRSDAFNGSQANAYGNQTYPGNGAGFDGYGQPATTGYAPAPTTGPRMTVDSVVQKTAISLGVVFLTAALTWFWTGDVTISEDNYAKLMTALTVGSLGAFALSLVNSFKRVVSPALVIAFAALEGVALGALSKFIDVNFASGAGLGDSIVMQAVIGTFLAFAGTLAAYKVLDIKVGQRFRTFVVAAMFGMVGLALVEMVLGMFGNQIGFFGFDGLGLVFAVVGLVLGVFMLILDFDFVEQGVAAGIEERESWRAAFAMTVSLVWIYTNLLRILAIFSQD